MIWRYPLRLRKKEGEKAKRYGRVVRMVELMEEMFDSCTNYGECEAVRPKEIGIDFIARMNRDYLKAKFKGVEG